MTASPGQFRGYGVRQRRPGSDRRILEPMPDYWEAVLGRAEAAVVQPFVGVTTDGTPLSGMFPIQQTGVPTRSTKEAADAFVATLTPEQRKLTLHPIDSQEWRRWSNWEQFPLRHGL